MTDHRTDADTLLDLIDLDRSIDMAETQQENAHHAASWARWEFGKIILAEREANGGKQLPRGRMQQLADATGKSATELKYRAKLAEWYPTEQELVTAVTTSQTWTELRRGPKDDADLGAMPASEVFKKASKRISAAVRWAEKQLGTRLHELTEGQSGMGDTWLTFAIEDLAELHADVVAGSRWEADQDDDDAEVLHLPTATGAEGFPYPVHPALAEIPMMRSDELQALADDVRKYGQREPIALALIVDGDPDSGWQLIDGRNRLKACEIAGVEPIFAEHHMDVADIAAWVRSTNLLRRAGSAESVGELATVTPLRAG